MGIYNLALARGSPMQRLLTRCGLHWRPDFVIASLLLMVAALPIALMCFLHGTLFGDAVAIPMTADYAMLSRLLVGLPILVVSAQRADRLVRAAIRQLDQGEFVHGRQRAVLASALGNVRRLREAWLPEIALLALAQLPVASTPMPESSPLDSWYWIAGTVSEAGWWWDHVALPIFRYFVLMWAWRFVLWSWLLWRFARLPLDLQPAHPDNCGGMAFLGLAQTRFAVLSLVGGVVLSGSCANDFVYAGHGLQSIKYLLVGYCVGSTVVFLAPLALLSPALLRAKRHALVIFEQLGLRGAREFGQAWKHQEVQPAARLIDSPAPSALADFSAVYTTVSGMSVIPIGRGTVLLMLAAAVVPMVPLVFMVMSLDDLFRRLASILM